MIEDAPTRRLLLALTLAAVVGSILLIEHPWRPNPSTVPAPPGDLPASERSLPGAATFDGATGWVNSDPVDLVALRGRVVLVDFWTYSCINCIRTLPHVVGLYETYKDAGFTVIGVHTPEFAFEKERANVVAATQRYGVHYPVPQDNADHIWDAYHNHYWPADYLVDPYGKIRFTHFGEGGYVDAEDHVRQLLVEAGHKDLPPRFETTDASGGSVAGLTPELYAEHGRSAIGNPSHPAADGTATFSLPASLDRDRIYLDGTWRIHDDFVEATGDASVHLRFRAGAGNMVAGSADATCLGISLDGGPLTNATAGKDVDRNAGPPCLPMDGERSYDFYAGALAEHTVVLNVPAGFQLYTFDFGVEPTH